MERLCPGAWMLNYTNPEAKLVEMISRETGIKVAGLCHGEQLGLDQLSLLLDMPKEALVTDVTGINHFGWFTKIEDKSGNDLYPVLREKERQKDWAFYWDWLALSRVMLRVYGLWSYPGTSHVGEYIAWSDAYMKDIDKFYFHDPATQMLWGPGTDPKASFAFEYDGIYPLDKARKERDDAYKKAFDIKDGELWQSGEYGVPIIEAIYFDKPLKVGAVIMPNTGFAKGLPMGMAVEIAAVADGRGLTPCETAALPTAINAMIALQGSIHQLVYEAYKEKSKNKLLQAVLLDPTVSSYNSAVAMINEMCELQKDILPELN
jgi:alpha-galactosidase